MRKVMADIENIISSGETIDVLVGGTCGIGVALAGTDGIAVSIAGTTGVEVSIAGSAGIEVTLIEGSLIPHNNLLSKQGGTTNEYYHLTAAEAQKVAWIHPPDDGELTLTPKASSSSTAEGTMFYCSDDNSVYVGVE